MRGRPFIPPLWLWMSGAVEPSATGLYRDFKLFTVEAKIGPVQPDQKP